ncbi:E3 ubiquitin-protein ligase TRIM39-like [Carettochelys insculpta]|uniref:E3 ubiquitin-protein ligase TRIM39-like n=1 Tax=Carettochelys insculpta TaxID=44489 RepID=UPI003EBC3D6D
MGTVDQLHEEASCSICLEYFHELVSIHCGHNFCRACIARRWGAVAADFSCPQCRQTALQRNFRLNRELANTVELVKQLRLPPTKGPEEGKACEKHGEPLKLFCVEDKELICLVCREAGSHRTHPVVPCEEAAQKYKEQVKARLQALKEKREKLQGWKLAGERRSWEFMSYVLMLREKLKQARQRIGFEFQQRRQFLEEQERLLLARLEERQKETVTGVPTELSHLNSLITELEEKNQQPTQDSCSPRTSAFQPQPWELQGAQEGAGEGDRGDMKADDAAMAAESPVPSLQDEASCSICLEYFKDPVSIHCGHNFCRACITEYWGESDSNFSCPQCRETALQRNFRPNRELAKIIEIAKRLSLQAAKGSGGDRACEKHQETLKLFCKVDQAPICLICRESQAHRSHMVVPVEEAAQEYKEKVQIQLHTLREEREKLMGRKLAQEATFWDALEQIETERLKVLSEFEHLRQVLEEQEHLLLARLEELDKEIEKRRDEKVTELSAEISRLSDLISELDGKCRQPASEFLQDVRSTLRRCELDKVLRLAMSPELEETFTEQERTPSLISRKTIALKETLRKFQAEVTLDPDTAHPRLALSEDGKSVRWEDARRPVPDLPQRFDSSRCVLGREGFTSGRHYWEVEVEDGGAWAVGVARESVRRKGRVSVNPEEGIWAMGQCGSQYLALTSPKIPLSLAGRPRTLGVYLDCEGGRVAFFDADNEAPIFTFPPGSVPDETIHPLLCLGRGSRFRLGPCPMGGQAEP